LSPPERLRNVCCGFGGLIQAHRHDEHAAASHHVRALVSKIPFETEVAFVPRGCIGRNYRDEECAVVNLAANLLIPDVPTPELALVQKDFNARGSQRRADPLRRLGILGGITQKYSV
jgi:hypothetical protein